MSKLFAIYPKSRQLVIQKCTQIGITELLIVLTLNGAIKGRKIFYVMPTNKQLYKTIHDRFDLTVDNTPYYGKLKRKSGAQSVTMKHFGKGVVNFASSQVPGEFTGFPADDVYIDELDWCDQKTILMAKDRQGESSDPRTIFVSNPTIPNHGISLKYEESTRDAHFEKCPHCNRWQVFDFFTHIVRRDDQNSYHLLDKEFDINHKNDIRMFCENPKCSRVIPRYSPSDKSCWVRETENAQAVGVKISKLFASRLPLSEIYADFLAGQIDDDMAERFYNSHLGEPVLLSGRKITELEIDECIPTEGYKMPDEITEGYTLMGVDVGSVFNIMIAQILPDNINLKLVYVGTVKELDDVFDLAKRYRVKIGCMDADPETRIGKIFAAKKNIDGVRRLFYRVQYHYGPVDTYNKFGRLFKSHRTSALDNTKSFIENQRIQFPSNARSIDGLYSQLTSGIKIYDEKNTRYVWKEGNKPDHYQHTLGYLITAFNTYLRRDNGYNT